jgi:hypothetical protein
MTFWVWAASYEEALLFATVREDDLPGYRFTTREEAEKKTKFWLGKLDRSEPRKRKLWSITVMEYV